MLEAGDDVETILEGYPWLERGETSWLASPTLDASSPTSASRSFRGSPARVTQARLAFDMDLREELLGLVDCLDAARIDYAVCGGLALAIHGYPRFTKEIDILVRPEDLERAVAAVSGLGFDLDAGILPFEVGGPRAREVRRISKTEGGEVLTLDLLVVSPVLESAWRSRGVFEWKDRRLRVVSREGLAEMKRLAGREQDLLDARRLESSDDEADA